MALALLGQGHVVIFRKGYFYYENSIINIFGATFLLFSCHVVCFFGANHNKMEEHRYLVYGSPEHVMIEDLVKTGFRCRIAGDQEAIRVGRINYDGPPHRWDDFFIQVQLPRRAQEEHAKLHEDYLKGELILAIRVYFFVEAHDRNLIQANCYDRFEEDSLFLKNTIGGRIYREAAITIQIAPVWGGTWLIFDEYNESRTTLYCRVGGAMARRNLHQTRALAAHGVL